MDLLSNVLPVVVVLLVLFVLLNAKNRRERAVFQQVEEQNSELLEGRFRNPVLRRRFMRALVRHCTTEGGDKLALTLAMNAAAMAKEPRDQAACRYLVGCCYEELEEYAQALLHFKEACGLESDFLIAQIKRARLLSLMRDPSCVGAFEMVLSLAPDSAAQYSNYGMALLRLGRYEESEMQLKKAIELKQDFVTPRELLAMLYEVMGETELAEAAMRAAVAYGSDENDVRQAIREFKETLQ